MPSRAGMSKAQSIDTVLPASFIESLSLHRLGSFSTSGAALSAGLPFRRLKTLSASIMPTSQMSNAASFGSSWNPGANRTWVMPAGGTHPVLTWQVAH